MALFPSNVSEGGNGSSQTSIKDAYAIGRLSTKHGTGLGRCQGSRLDQLRHFYMFPSESIKSSSAMSRWL